MLAFLEKFPYWLWVLIPALLLALITYIFTRNKRYTMALGILALGAATLTAFFHLWEVYLHTHFIGTFDHQGLPTNFSASGWALILVGWPLWVMPTAIVAIIIIVVASLLYLLSEKWRKKIKKSPFTVQKYMALNLDYHQLEKKLAVANKTIGSLKKALKQNPESHALVTQEKTIKTLQKEIDNLKSTLKTRETELSEARSMVKSLMAGDDGEQQY